jgi:hypothetical protein
VRLAVGAASPASLGVVLSWLSIMDSGLLMMDFGNGAEIIKHYLTLLQVDQR